MPAANLTQYIGWYDSPEQTTPTHDPPHDGPCIVCVKPLKPDDVRTISVLYQGGNKSLFYRMHKSCALTLTPKEEAMYDGAVLDAFPESLDAARARSQVGQR